MKVKQWLPFSEKYWNMLWAPCPGYYLYLLHYFMNSSIFFPVSCILFIKQIEYATNRFRFSPIYFPARLRIIFASTNPPVSAAEMLQIAWHMFILSQDYLSLLNIICITWCCTPEFFMYDGNTRHSFWSKCPGAQTHVLRARNRSPGAPKGWMVLAIPVVMLQQPH